MNNYTIHDATSVAIAEAIVEIHKKYFGKHICTRSKREKNENAIAASILAVLFIGIIAAAGMILGGINTLGKFESLFPVWYITVLLVLLYMSGVVCTAFYIDYHKPNGSSELLVPSLIASHSWLGFILYWVCCKLHVV